MKLIVDVTVVGKPDSINRSYRVGNGEFYKKKSKYFKSLEAFLRIEFSKLKISLDGSKMYFLSFTETQKNFLTKKNVLSKTRGDSDRYIKPVKDLVAKCLGVDDYIFIGESTIQKIGNNDSLRIEIYEVTE